MGTVGLRRSARRCSGGRMMISVILPYWNRQAVLAASLARYRELYADLHMEIVIVDDGSPERGVVDGDFPWRVQLVRLPYKTTPMNSCVPINLGVEASSGEYVVLTSPEVMHRAPILSRLREECERLGPKGYVSAACWGVERKFWYCHSTLEPDGLAIGRAKVPEGAKLHFCAMLRRALFDEVGGFSEEYRDGVSYEDNDFLWKLHRAGAVFGMRDDLVTDHMPAPRCKWPAGGLERNRKLFERTWGR